MAKEDLGASPSASNELVRVTDVTELAQDAVGAALANSARITLAYSDATPSITADLVGDSVVNAYLANMAQSTIKGRAAGAGTGDPTDLTPAQVKTVLGYAGSEVAFTPAGSIAATNVQAAIAELDTEVDARLDAVEIGTTLHEFTASGSLAAATVTGAKKLRIRCVGGGGAGGGAEATGASQSSGGAGGQGGHYAETVVATSSIVWPLTVTVGAGGTPVAGVAGGNGGTSSVVDATPTTHCSAGGGTGGGIVTTASAAGTFGSPGNGNVASMVGSIQVRGGVGGRAFKNAAAGPVFAGGGGASVLGGSAMESNSINLAGANGSAYGGGGSGSARSPSNTSLIGGFGAPGIVIIEAIY
jgi:hypothetical protein